MTPAEITSLADRFFGAIEKGDVASIRELYAPDVVVWHNYDQRAKTREENVAMLEQAIGAIEDMRYEEVRRQLLPAGFVQQHVLRGRARATGRALELPACLVIDVADGRIIHLDEYFDREPLAVLQA